MPPNPFNPKNYNIFLMVKFFFFAFSLEQQEGLKARYFIHKHSFYCKLNSSWWFKCYIFSQGYSLYFFLISAHLWWFGVLGFCLILGFWCGLYMQLKSRVDGVGVLNHSIGHCITGFLFMVIALSTGLMTSFSQRYFLFFDRRRMYLVDPNVSTNGKCIICATNQKTLNQYPTTWLGI